MAERVLIAGGAGFFGSMLVDAFAGDDVRVCVLDRGSPPEWAQEARIDYVRGDIRDRALVAQAVEGANTVVHAAFASPRAPAEIIRPVNVDGTENLCACALAKGVRRFILISSTVVAWPPKVHPCLSRSPLTRYDLYRASRADAESIVARYHARGLSTAVVRPKTFVGPGCLSAFAILFERIRLGGRVPVLGTGRNRYQLLDIRDFADAVRRLAWTTAAGVICLGARELRTVREDLQSLVDHAGSGARLQFIPGLPARFGLRAMELAGMVPLAEWHYMSARGEDSIVDISRAERELGWHPQRSNAQALREAFDWYVATLNARGRVEITHSVPLAHQVLKKLGSIFA
jgi:nucleoside-diphosphate-sugar epimerase